MEKIFFLTLLQLVSFTTRESVPCSEAQIDVHEELTEFYPKGLEAASGLNAGVKSPVLYREAASTSSSYRNLALPYICLTSSASSISRLVLPAGFFFTECRINELKQ